MSNANISIIGLYNANNHIFDLMQIPEALNRETLIDNILLETAELEALYPNAEFLKLVIGSWSKKELPVWEKLYETTVLEYNPIWNKDGKITEIEKSNRDHAGTDISSGNTSNSGNTSSFSENGTQSKTSGHSGKGSSNSQKQENSVAAYNSPDYENRDKTITDGETNEHSVVYTDDEVSGHNLQKDETNNTMSESKLGKTESKEAEERIFQRIEQGNIGVTSTQQLIKEEREVAEFNVISYIVDSFKKRFCLLIY